MKGISNLKHTLFVKYILTYTLLFALPFIVLFSLIYFSMINTMRNEYRISIENRTESIKEQIENVLENMQNTANQISIDNRLTPYMLKYGGIMTKNAIDAIKQYNIIHNYVDEFAIYIDGTDKIYTSFGMYHLNDYFKYRYKLNDITINEYINTITNVTTSQFINHKIQLLSINNVEYNTFICPLKHNNTVYGQVIYTIRSSYFKKIINSFIPDDFISFYIYNNDNEILMENNREYNDFTNELLNLKKISFNIMDDQENHFLTSDDKNCIIECSNKFNLNYLSVFAYKKFNILLSCEMEIYIWVTIILLLIGFILIIFLSYTNYSPIKRLISNIQCNTKQNEQNELELLESYFIKQKNLYDALEQKLFNHKNILTDTFIIRLLQGRHHKLNECNDIMDSIEGYNCFVITAIINEKKMKSVIVKDLIKQNIEEKHEKAQLYCVEIEKANTIGILVKLTNVYEENLIQEVIANDVKNRIAKCTNVKFTLGYGNICNKLDDIKYSFAKSSIMAEKLAYNKEFDTNFYDKDNSIISCFNEIDMQLLLLEQIISEGEIEDANRIIDNIFYNDLKRIHDIQNIRSLCLYLLTLFLKIVNNLKITEYNSRIHSLNTFVNIDTLYNDIKDILKSICNKNLEKNNDKNSKLINKIIEYIHEHYWEIDFSQPSIAEKFNMSSSYFSRFFSTNYKNSFIQYVTDLKMKEVKRKLVETDDSTTKIIKSVGYTDRPNFTRRFKKIEGCTMTEYRQTHKFQNKNRNYN